MHQRRVAAVALVLAACKREPAARLEPLPEPVLDAGAPRAVAAPPAAIASEARIYFQLAVYHSAPPALKRAKALLASERSALHFEEKPSREPAVPTVFIHEPLLESYVPPDARQLEHFGRGFTPEDGRRIADSKRVSVIEVTARRGDEGNAALRAAHVLALDLARAVSGYIWDETTRETFTPAAFEKRRLAAWAGGVPRASSQYVIHAYRERELIRIITLGMGKLGLPDLVVEDVSDAVTTRLGKVVALVAQSLAEGVRPDASGNLSLDIEALRDADERALLLREVVPGGKKRAQVRLVEGRHERGDPENQLVELDFGAGPERQVRQAALVAGLFGIEDKVTSIRDGNTVIAEASARARQRLLGEVKPRFLKGLPFNERLTVKAPFRDSEKTEWMWVQVVRWEGHQIRGVLKNQPYDLRNIHQGAQVSVDEGRIFDYQLHLPDGGSEGNETEALIDAAGAKSP
jgi:uncharacterized protein YegJ (DUF2314 family)